jgi:hypothetical protein
LSDDRKRELFAVIVNHERLSKVNMCRCGGVWPCRIGESARMELVAAGVDLGQTLGWR